MKNTVLKTWFACCIGAISIVTAHAENKSTANFAVLSLIGDNLSSVTYETSTGTMLNRNRHELMPSGSSIYDDAVVSAVGDVIKQYRPEASVQKFSSNSEHLYRLQDKLLALPGDEKAGMDLLSSMLKINPATYLILITKHRGDMRLGTLASAKLEGLGFYMDNTKELSNGAGEIGKGFLAPYINIKLTLLDAKTLTVICEKVITDSMVVASAGEKAGLSTFNLLTQDERVESLKALIHNVAHDVVPNILTAVPM